jgi:hypothetical protein
MPKRPILTQDRIRRILEVMMAQQETHISTDRARAGSTPHIVRYVLGISLALAIVAMALILGVQ